MRIFKSVVLLAALAAMAAAADKPNFSGEWSVNADKSNFGPMPPPASMTRKVDHSDPALSYTQAVVGGPQGDQTITMKLSTDGKETTNELMGNPVKSSAKWDGSALMITAKADFGGAEITLTDKWTLSDDGKILTDAMHVVSPQGEFDITYVMDKK